MSSVRSPAPSLSKIRRPVSKKVSPLLRGESICQQLRSSSFGGFHAAVHEIKSYLSMVAFKLPTVIVVGGRSAGKSSLLENITKCPVFPRDPALCTKMPVKLQLIQVAKESDCSVTIGWRGSLTPLQSKDDILQEVAKIMDSVDGIVTDELTVAICQVKPLSDFCSMVSYLITAHLVHHAVTLLMHVCTHSVYYDILALKAALGPLTWKRNLPNPPGPPRPCSLHACIAVMSKLCEHMITSSTCL